MTGHIFETYKHDFERDGFVMMQDALTAQQVQDMNAQLREWVDESRNYKKNYGRIADGRPRFDVEPTSHSPETPALRRISAPIEVSDVYLDVMRNNAALDHCQISHYSKEPGHRHVIDALGKTAILDLDLRLGEASGAAIALQIVRSALAAHNGMATFAEAGVSDG